MSKSKRAASLCMEVGIEPKFPIYSGGLGCLHGDMLKAAADLGLPVDGYSILYHKGNYRQKLSDDGWQSELNVPWYPDRHMKKLDQEIKIRFHGNDITVNIWKYEIRGAKNTKGYNNTVPVYLFDSNNRENPQGMREATNYMYDKLNRIYQGAILGIGAVRFGEKLGIDYKKYHFNEGDPSFAVFELIKKGLNLEDIIERCVFTTHTPVEDSLQKFAYHDIYDKLGELVPSNIKALGGADILNMTLLALTCSGYSNAVSKKHAQVSKRMFNKDFDYITNGVHSETWTSDSFKKLYDKHCKGWRGDSEQLKNAKNIPLDDIIEAHMAEKKKMIDLISRLTYTDLDPDILTIGFARRMAKYKRPDLIFEDINELVRIGDKKLQLVFAGKAHPFDKDGKDIIKNIFDGIKKVSSNIKCAYLEDYNMYLCKVLTSGCDVWLNNPLSPLEASGTSGMCAAHNGVPQLGTLDGWWLEGLQEGVTGWGIGRERDNHQINFNSDEAWAIRKEDAISLRENIENKIKPVYENKEKFAEISRNAISINASHFNAHRMIKEYAEKAFK
jgi:starch phosphorylase